MTDPVILIMMVATIGVTVAIGLHAYRDSKTEQKYFAYGQQMRWVVLGLATFSTIMSGFGFIGGPGLVYAQGTTSLWMTFAAALGIPLSFALLGRRMHELAGPDVLTVPDAVYRRFQSRTAQGAVALGILLGILAYLGSQMLAAAFVIQQVFGASFAVSFFVSLTVVALYPLVGGIVAGIRTEVFQGGIMIVASVLVFFFALSSGGGMAQITADVARDNQRLVSPWGTLPPLAALGYLFVFGIGAIGMPHSIGRFLMIRDTRQLRYGVLLATGAYMVGSLLWMIVGFAIRARVATGDLTALAAADQAAPTFLTNFTPNWLAGIAFAGLMSAILSTASVLLNVGSAALTRDIPMALGRPAKDPVLAARIGTGLLAVISGALAYWSQELVALLGAVGYGLHAATLVPTLALGLWWRGATAAGVIASTTVAVLGSIYFFIAQQLGFAASHGWWIPAHGFPSVGLVLLLSLIAFIVASYATNQSSARAQL